MQLTHPVGVTGGQVVVDGHHVHTVARQGVEIHRQRRHQGLALAGLHLGDPSEVQGHPTHQLDVVVALAQDPSRRLAHHGVGLDQEVIEGFSLGEALFEDVGLRAQFGVGQPGHLSRELVDGADEFGKLTSALTFTGLEDLLEHTHDFTTLPV